MRAKSLLFLAAIFLSSETMAQGNLQLQGALTPGHGVVAVDINTVQDGGPPATIPAGANPTATAGPSAINGSAATFMRSDAAPAVQDATNAQKGLAQCDGTTITCASGVISGVPSVGAAKAWVNFTGGGTTINSQMNVSSITFNATGDYTVNFTTNIGADPMCHVSFSPAGTVFSTAFQSTPTTSAARVVFYTIAGALADPVRGYVSCYAQ